MDDKNPTPPKNPQNNSVEPDKPAESNEDKAVQTTSPPKPIVMHTRSYRKLGTSVALIIIVLILAGLAWWYVGQHKSKPVDNTKTTTSQVNKPSDTTTVQGLQLDSSKNYGNKYADGILPVGDGKYTTSGPKIGYGYACSGYASNLETQAGGAGKAGPWFMDNDTEYNINKKLHVEGSVSWNGMFNDTVSGSTRVITSNDLPIGATTGIFPIQASDPAYAYDKNPNTITAQSFTYNLAANPVYSSTPNCIGGQVGVMLNGVALFSAFDAGGRDAGAWEVQDSCSGHPQSDGIYHYHTMSSCIKNVSVHTVIGYALDGFPITGPDVGTNNILTTSDLDECHGIVSSYTADGKTTTGYHYVMTEDFPYSVSCYRGTPITPPGQGSGQSGQQGQSQPPAHP